MPHDAARGELLAENTTESLRILRVGEWVYKFLRPHDSFGRLQQQVRQRELHYRVQVSRRSSEFNPLTFDESANCIISRYVHGTLPTQQQIDELKACFLAAGRGYIKDIRDRNIVVVENRPVVIDFQVDERHPHFLRWFASIPS
jgi:hypothetical protein